MQAQQFIPAMKFQSIIIIHFLETHCFTVFEYENTCIQGPNCWADYAVVPTPYKLNNRWSMQNYEPFGNLYYSTPSYFKLNVKAS